jgi:type IV secretory pathway TrbL component
MSKVGTAEAWQVRGSQRQDLMEDLIQASYREEAELDDETFHIGLVSVIAEYLKSRRKGIVKPVIEPDNLGTFFATVLGVIRNFAWSKVEEDALIAQLMEKVMAVGLRPFQSVLLEQDRKI